MNIVAIILLIGAKSNGSHYLYSMFWNNNLNWCWNFGIYLYTNMLVAFSITLWNNFAIVHGTYWMRVWWNVKYCQVCLMASNNWMITSCFCNLSMFHQLNIGYLTKYGVLFNFYYNYKSKLWFMILTWLKMYYHLGM